MWAAPMCVWNTPTRHAATASLIGAALDREHLTPRRAPPRARTLFLAPAFLIFLPVLLVLLLFLFLVLPGLLGAALARDRRSLLRRFPAHDDFFLRLRRCFLLRGRFLLYGRFLLRSGLLPGRCFLRRRGRCGRGFGCNRCGLGRCLWRVSSNHRLERRWSRDRCRLHCRRHSRLGR